MYIKRKIIPPNEKILGNKRIITDKNFIPLLVTFLKENRAYMTYRAQRYKIGRYFEHFSVAEKPLGEIPCFTPNQIPSLNLFYAKDILSQYFDSENTKQGKTFWVKMNKAWTNFIETHKLAIERVLIPSRFVRLVPKET